MLVKRHVADYYNGIFTVDDLDKILRQVIIYHNKYVEVEVISLGLQLFIAKLLQFVPAVSW